MKRLIVLIALLAIASSAPATTLGNWGSGGAGLWSDGTKWAAGSVPGLGTSTGDEIKVQAANADVTIDSTAALDYNVRLTAGGATGVVIRIVSGATFGMGEWRNGAQGNATTGGNCTTYQTGGTLNVSDLIMGRGGSSSTLGVAETTTYTISGGTIQTRSGGNGRLYVGGANNTGAGASLHNATFTVDGAASIISLRKLYVGASDATHGATGNLEFNAVLAQSQSGQTVTGRPDRGLQSGHAQGKAERLELGGLQDLLQGSEVLFRNRDECGQHRSAPCTAA